MSAPRQSLDATARGGGRDSLRTGKITGNFKKFADTGPARIAYFRGICFMNQILFHLQGITFD
jgi:hypothetical protein